MQPTPLQKIENPYGIALYIKREDQNHPLVQGNKWHKVRPNMAAAKTQGMEAVLTFGGAFSNHLHATAAAGHAIGMPTIGVVRGQAADFGNPTLSACARLGMHLFKIDKKIFDAVCTASTLPSDLDFSPVLAQIYRQHSKIYTLPMGGSNALGIQGCIDFGKMLQEQLESLSINFSKNKVIVAVPSGTGGTAAGLLVGFDKKAQILAFPPMKGGLEKSEILQHLHTIGRVSDPYADYLTVIPETHFGGYGRISPELMAYSTGFEQKHKIALDPIYTAKMMFNLEKMLESISFPSNTILVAVHTGGLQGKLGFT